MTGASVATAVALAAIAAGFAQAPGSWASAAGPPARGAPPGTGTPTPAGRSPLEVTGASRIEYDDASQQWMFLGARVVVVRGTVRVEAPEILYRERAREVVLPRGGAVVTPTLEVTADRIAAQLGSQHVVADGHVSGRFSNGDEPSPGGPQQRVWTTFASDRLEADDRQELQQIVATGQVVIVRESRRLSGDRVVYRPRAQEATVDGHAELARGSDRVRADHVVADLGRQEARADDHVLLDHEDIHGTADHATYSEPAETAVLSGNVMLLRGRDTLTADRATVFLVRHTAVAEGHVRLVAYPEGSSP